MAIKTGLAKFPTMCKVCGNMMQPGQSISWNSFVKKSARHSDCFGKPDTIITPDSNESEPDTSEVQSTTPVRTVSAGNGDLAQMLAGSILPYIEGKISAKFDAAEIEETISRKVNEAIENATRRIVVENKTGETTVTVTLECVHEKFQTLLKLIQKGMHVYLFGGPGSGKSTAAKQVAEALGRTYGYISLTAQTAESRVLGYNDANGRYVETEFYRLYSKGGVFCIDEMDNASANLLTALNSALENGHAAFPCGMVEKHKDFVLVATGNTAGIGANPMFPERRPMDAAFRERFVFLSWEYDEKLEKTLATSVNPKAGKWVAWVQEVRKYAAKHNPRLMVTPRASIKGAELLTDFDPETVSDMVMFKGIDADTRSKILTANPLPRIT
jgi:cobaltochelatase CobS